MIRNLCLLGLAVLFISGRSYSQESDGHFTNRAEVTQTRKPGLRRGTNEVGAWIGYSLFSFVLKGPSKQRALFLLNLQYARTIFATRPFTLKYTADVVPLTLEFQPTHLYTVAGKPLVNPGGTLYAAGANPIGFQGNIGSKWIQAPLRGAALGFFISIGRCR